jgi:hypothetical protein
LALCGSLLFVSAVETTVAAWQGALICAVPAWLLALRAAQECAAGMAAIKRLLTTTESKKAKVREILRRVGSDGDELGVPHATKFTDRRPPRPLTPTPRAGSVSAATSAAGCSGTSSPTAASSPPRSASSSSGPRSRWSRRGR